MSTNNSKGAAADKAETKGAVKKIKTGTADPAALLIIGLDVKADDPRFASEDGQKVYAELEDPDRIKVPPSKGFVKSLLEKGYDDLVAVVEYKPAGSKETLLLVGDGRQRVMGGRIANTELAAEHRLMVPYFVRTAGMTALDVTRANEWSKKDSPLIKARRAARLASLGYSTEEIIGAFSDDGARAISKMTLSNWRSLLKCSPKIQDLIEAGECPVAVGYELGKIKGEGGTDAEKDADRHSKQEAALEKIKAEGGTLKGVAGRANAAAEADADDEDGDGEGNGEGGSNGSGGGKKRAKSSKMSAGQIRKAAEIFSADDEEPYEQEPIKPEDTGHSYQELVGALFSVIIGDDPTGKGLKKFGDSVYKPFSKILRSEKVKKDTDGKGKGKGKKGADAAAK